MTRILIAEDEDILRQSLEKKLDKFWPRSKSIKSVENGSEALQAMSVWKPEIAFLDIQMGDVSGIDVVKQSSHSCHVVFVTAYDEYAIQAFDTGAIDYLLKPYSDSRLKACLERLTQRLSSVPLDLKKLLADVQTSGAPYLKRLNVQIGNKVWLVPIETVICFKASGRYVKVVTAEREALVRVSLKNLLEQLDPDNFWQVHRSTIINICHLDHVKHIEHDQIQAYLRGLHEPIAISRSYGYLFRNLTSDF